MEVNSSITQNIHILKYYIRQAGKQGVKPSVLGVIETMLAKLQNHLSPPLILRSLFNLKTITCLAKLLTDEEDEHSTSEEESEEEHASEKKILEFFRISLKQVEVSYNPQSFNQPSLLLTQISEALEEWENIQRAASELTAKVEETPKMFKAMTKIETQSCDLESLLNKIIRNTEQTDSIDGSIELCGDLGLSETLRESEIIAFIDYLSMWLSHLLEEIIKFKVNLLFFKGDLSNSQHSSLCQDQQSKIRKIRDRFLQAKNKPRTSLLTKALKKQKTSQEGEDSSELDLHPNLNTNFCLKPSKAQHQKEYSLREKKGQQRRREKENRRTTSEKLKGKIDAGSTAKHPPKQIQFKAKQRPCAECQIY